MRSEVIVILRKCTECGLEAHTIEDLEKFSANPASKYGRQNICKECYNTRKREYWKKPEANKRKKRTQRRFNLRRIIFQGKRILLKENPRTNVCEECGRKYPDDLDEQTSFHHEIYNPANPLAYTKELCRSCHSKLLFGPKHPRWKGDAASNSTRKRWKHRAQQRAKIPKEEG